MKKSKSGKFILSLLLCIGFCFMATFFTGCIPLYESATCKVNNVAYSSLSQALLAAKDGDTIFVYNDVKETLTSDNFVGVFQAGSANGHTYVSYDVRKKISIQGVSQNYHTPIIYGSIHVNIGAEDVFSMNNVEVVNDYISLTDNSLNKPFEYCLDVVSGITNITNCSFHMSTPVENSALKENDIVPINGVRISRGSVTKLLDYTFQDNKIGVYGNSYGNLSSCGLTFVCPWNSDPKNSPTTINNIPLDRDFYTNFSYFNNISSSATTFDIHDSLSGAYLLLLTDNSSLVDQKKFTEESYLELNSNLEYQYMTDFYVYCPMKFDYVRNVHFIIKTANGKVNYSSSSQNVTITTYSAGEND